MDTVGEEEEGEEEAGTGEEEGVEVVWVATGTEEGDMVEDMFEHGMGSLILTGSSILGITAIFLRK